MIETWSREDEQRCCYVERARYHRNRKRLWLAAGIVLVILYLAVWFA